RRAPNVSQYLADLNTIPSAQDPAAQNQDEFAGLDNDMALFTNTDFFDFDLGEVTRMAQPSDFDSAEAPDFQFPDFHFAPNFADGHNPDIKPAMPHSGPLQHASPTATSPTSRALGPQSGDKRKLDYMGDPNGAQVMEEASRLAAEEDKRRRNTAASARFRIKKKQREQALEKTSKEMTEKVNILENRVQQLEMENKWLKGLITEKNDKTDISAMFQEFTKDLEKSRSKEDRKDGVGT
ncbi:hypothetical protein NA57DRAFT_24731, partial [Rhizodiscina lignyota]